jgi:hypothetical protein
MPISGVPCVHYITNRRSKNNHATRKSPEHICWIRALVFILYKDDPPKLYKKESTTKSNKLCWKGWFLNIVFFQYIYIDKEQIAGPKYGHATRKFPGYKFWARALIFVQRRPSKVVKNESSTKSNKWCWIGRLLNMVFFQYIYIDKKQIAGSKNGHATRKFPGLRLWFNFVQRKPSKDEQKRICNKIKHMVLKGLAFEYGVFSQ